MSKLAKIEGMDLMTAVQQRRIDLIPKLLDLGYNINSKIRWGEYSTRARTVLIEAVNRETFEDIDLEIIRLLLDRGADINTVGGDHGTPLAIAVYARENEIIQTLLDRGADVNALGGSYGTALATAAYCGEKGIIQMLLDRGADINPVGGYYGTALAAAAYSRKKEIFQMLLDRGADINPVGGHYGTVLAVAACSREKEIFQILLDRGADIHAVGGSYGTALAAAAYEGKTETFQILLDRGADINTVGGDYGTALGAAAYSGQKGIFRILLDRGADINTVGGHYGTALAAAAYSGNEEVARMLLDREADINTVGGNYGTALAAAAFMARNGVVQMLLDREANINMVGGHYGTALAAAARQGNKEIVQILLDRGADINIADGHYGTALAAAAFMGRNGVVQMLLDRGANINMVGGHYGTALAAATHQGNKEIVQILLDCGADINIVGGDYGTALAAAAYVGQTEVAQMLLDRGADTNAVGGDYGTALAAAAYEGRKKTAQMLLDRGADVNTVGGDYGTALGACVAGRCAIAIDAYNQREVRDQYEEIMELLLARGVAKSINTTLGCKYGTVLDNEIDAACTENVGKPVENLLRSLESTIPRLLNHGADMNIVGTEYGTPLGKAANDANTALVIFLLAHGADVFNVGSSCKYETEHGGSPTALDVALQGGKADPDLLKLLSDNMEKNRNESNSTPWPPFPMPFVRSSPAAVQIPDVITSDISSCSSGSVDIARCLEPIFKLQTQRHATWLTSEQADIPCRAIDRDVLVRVLVTLVDICPEGAQRQQWWIQNDVRYFMSHDYDLGLAYSAARHGWRDFNDTSLDPATVAVIRHRMLRRAWKHITERVEAIQDDGVGSHQVIKSPYAIMPRRLWDVWSNRVVDFGMPYAASCICSGEDHGLNSTVPSIKFWAITHSWTNSMESVKTPINSLEWPVPLPKELNIENDLRKELLDLGAEYVWLDVLCLRQESSAQHYPDYSERNRIRNEEWKIDVPTIGNIYRSAAAVVRYFNGLGKPFRTEGWDSPRHWLQRAWTLQEIKNENITINGGSSVTTSAGILMNMQSTSSGNGTLREALQRILMNMLGKGPRNPTLRKALQPVLRLATEVDGPNGCSIYELAREMARRHATQPTDKVSGLWYLLRTTSLPAYSAAITADEAWASAFYLLPFGRKMEILFDFPYRADCIIPSGDESKVPWFPTWTQLMNWPTRNPDYDHSLPISPQADNSLQLAPGKFDLMSFYVTDVWAVSHIQLRATSDLNEYQILVGNIPLGFYCPYVSQTSIQIQDNQMYTLVTSYPQVSGNWVVCESQGVETQELESETPNGKVKKITFEVLKKVGVLRTDSCSVLFIGAETESKTLKKINALFI